MATILSENSLAKRSEQNLLWDEQLLDGLNAYRLSVDGMLNNDNRLKFRYFF